MKKIFLLFVIFLTPYLVFSQLSQKNVSKDKKKYTEAQNKFADYDFKGALVVYKELLTKYPEDYTLYTNIGKCYLEMPERAEAINYFQKAVSSYEKAGKQKTTDAKEAGFLLAKAYFINYEFDYAKATYIKTLDYATKKEKEIINQQIELCDFANDMYTNPKGFFVVYPDIINSEYPDYCPIVDGSVSTLFFTSRRSGSTGGIKDYSNSNYDDIYYADIENGVFSSPKNLGTPLNTNEHEATSSISFDGNELFIYRSSERDPGDIYSSKQTNGVWSTPTRLPFPINSINNETHASLSPDGNFIYFTSDRSGGEGELDIYVAEKNTKGEWGKAKNIGLNINTKYDEEGPFISPDGKTLYFSSKGHKGMGGFDIFKSTKDENGNWGAPVNMGFPLNTVDDDLFFVPTNDPTVAMYSSKQYSGTAGIYIVNIYDNIDDMIFVKGYVFDSNHKKLNPENTSKDSVQIAGKWYPKKAKYTYSKNDTLHITSYSNESFSDSICKLPTYTKIIAYKVKDGSTSNTLTTTKRKGNYGFGIKPKETHLVYYSSPNYIYDILKVDKNSSVVKYNAELDTIIIGKTKSVKQTFFDVETNELSDYQKIEFNILADFLKNNSNLYVDISAFGSNESLEYGDDEKQNSIIDLLLNSGVSKDKIYTNLSKNTISGSKTEYTIYDEQTIKEMIIDKDSNQIALLTSKEGILISDISFEINKFENAEFYDELNVLAKFLVENPTAKIGVYGYTDTQGNSDYNNKLSQKRADFVKNYLINNGANANQIVAEGRGYKKQISVNKDNEGNFIKNSLGYNRRVEIEIINQGENSILQVKPIDVPKNLALNNPTTYKYSILVLTTVKKIPNTSFEFEVTELVGSDGLYNYIHGLFETENEARNFQNSIKAKYPKALVFLNNYRK